MQSHPSSEELSIDALGTFLLAAPLKSSMPFWMALDTPEERFPAISCRFLGTLETTASENWVAAVFCFLRSSRVTPPLPAATICCFLILEVQDGLLQAKGAHAVKFLGSLNLGGAGVDSIDQCVRSRLFGLRVAAVVAFDGRVEGVDLASNTGDDALDGGQVAFNHSWSSQNAGRKGHAW